MYNTGTNFAFVTLSQCRDPDASSGAAERRNRTHRHVRWTALFSNVSLVPEAQMHPSEEDQKSYVYAPHRLPRLSWEPHWVGNKHTYQHEVSPFSSADAAVCRECGLLVVVRHPLSWLHSMCKPGQAYGCRIGSTTVDVHNRSCLERLVLGIGSGHGAMADAGFECADDQTKLDCEHRMTPTPGACFRNIGSLPEYYARWYGAHLRPRDGRARVWLRYEDLLLHADRTANAVCGAAGMVLPSGGLNVPEHKASPGGAASNASAAITKAADATTLYEGIEPALVARVANQINAVSPGLLEALGYSLAQAGAGG
jgi:hypothetical protein